MANRNYVICLGCGKKAEYTECSAGNTPPEDARCISLSGWLSVNQWQGLGAVEHYDFCSLIVSRSGQKPMLKVPKTFLEAFGDG